MTAGLLVADAHTRKTPGVADRHSPTTVAPLDLDSNPEIERFLKALGLGTFDRSALTAPFGRNDVWAGPTSSGTGAFVKRLRGGSEDVADRMRRSADFEALLAAQSAPGLLAPLLLGHDVERGLVAHELVAGAVSGAQHMVDETFDDELAHSAGAAVAALHEMVVPGGVTLDTSRPQLPSLDLVNGLSLQMFENASYGEIEAWRLQQNDPELLKALVALHERETGAARSPAHCDFRVDQLLVVDGAVLITDWEEFRLADPARDVGGFAGEWLYRSILDIVTSRGDDAFDDAALDHAAILSRGEAKLERLRPRIQHFWSAYRSARTGLEGDFVERAAAFAGWHMLDRLIAGSTFCGRLTGIERAAAGIGRGILINPAKFAPVIGMDL